ncbi:MAG: glycosyltransferase family 4 protein [Balneolaceae bacterium]
MQNVSIQLVESLKERDDIELITIINETYHSRYVAFRIFFYLLKLLWLIPLYILKHKPDIILFSSMVTAATLPMVAFKSRVRRISITHGQDVTLSNSLFQWYIKFVFKKLDGVISVSEATKKACIARGMDPGKGVILPNGFGFSEATDFPDKMNARKLFTEKFGIDLKNKIMLLTVGRHVKRKGHVWFIENVFSKINSDVVYVIIGEGPETENIENVVNKKKYSEKIYLLGRQAEEILKCAYAAADLFIMPNIPVEGDMEGFGIVLLEANIAGVPAIATDLEGIKDVIIQGVNGYRVPPEEPGSFANQINRILSNGELEKISKTSRDFVKDRYNWNAVADRYVRYFKNILNK